MNYVRWCDTKSPNGHIRGFLGDIPVCHVRCESSAWRPSFLLPLAIDTTETYKVPDDACAAAERTVAAWIQRAGLTKSK